MKGILPGKDKPVKREADVQTMLAFLDPKKKPHQVRDFEAVKR